jgi:uncharacterized protein (DUF302 family)
MLPPPSASNYEATRLELTFDVSHAAFTSAFEGFLGRMDVDALNGLATQSPQAVRAKLSSFVGPLDFTLFQKLDHGGLLTAFTGKPVRATTYVFGNALIAIEMTKHDARVGLYVPLRLFVHEIGERRVVVTYDLPSSTMAQFASPEVDVVARTLDEKVSRLLEETVKRARRVVEVGDPGVAERAEGGAPSR